VKEERMAKKKTQTRNEEIIDVARRYSHVGMAGFVINRGEYQLGGIDELKYLHSFGLNSEDPAGCIAFLELLKGLGQDIDEEAKILGIQPDTILEDKRLVQSIEDVGIKFPNGDVVSLVGYRDSDYGQYGRFVTGFNPETRTFGFSSERDHPAHQKLAQKYLLGYKIFEAGFAQIYSHSRTINLCGNSDAFRVGPGQISRTLLERALKEWKIK
jgi:hypothetical protein